MPRENSLSDSEGRSLTPDLEEVRAESPLYTSPPPRPNVQPYSPTNGATHTIRSQQTTRTHPFQLTPKDRFRNSVKRVIHLQRGTSTFFGQRGVGAEPGIDPRRESAFLTYGHIKQNCVIEVVDYSSVRVSFGRMTNNEFINFLYDPDASQRDPWVKVRWINIGGVSWDVLSALAIKYDIHPLALEDTIHHRDVRSKADYYTKHLFLRVTCHSLVKDSARAEHANAAKGSTLPDAPRVASPIPSEYDDCADDQEPAYEGLPSRVSTLRFLNGDKDKVEDVERLNRRETRPTFVHKSASILSNFADQRAKAFEKRKKEEITLKVLKKSGERVSVDVQTMFIFLFRDGTVITMHPQPDLEFTAPVAARVRQSDTSLRSSPDGSLLVQGILDLIVDRAMEVIEVYHEKIRKFERDILLKTDVGTVRNLHILSGDLILHKRSLAPIKQVIYGLRRYDLDRCAALVDSSIDPDAKIVGFMSHKAKIYLADVYDHMEYILSSLEMFSSIAENLIDYTFNMASYEMNIVMRRLTLITIICLPLTLLTGYFGMNFHPFWAVEENSDFLFWKIAIPVMGFLIPLFTWPDIIRMYRYAEKKVVTKKAIRHYKQE